MAEQELPTMLEIKAMCKRLYDLLDDPQPGLFTWLSFRNEAGKKLRDALNAVMPIGK